MKSHPLSRMSVMSSLYELERESIVERTEMGRKMYVMKWIKDLGEETLDWMSDY